MITVNNIVKAYNGNIVVDIPSLELNGGELIGLVGNNGAGKTTLFRLLLDLVRANKGAILSKEQEFSASQPREKVKGAVPGRRFPIPLPSPEEYFYFIG